MKKRLTPGLTLSIMLLLVLSSCKKEDITEEEDTQAVPVFGTCQAATPKGRLSQASAGTFTYRTNGGGIIEISTANIVIRHSNYPGFKIEYWGDAGTAGNPMNAANHENLNGKHIKDRLDVRRTILFPDGAKLTMIANGVAGQPVSYSIYDGAQVHRFNANCNYKITVEYSAVNSANARQLDDAEADGETATFEFVGDLGGGTYLGGLQYLNIYTENTPGNKVMNRVLLGELYSDSPTRVNDYFDDPRLGHT